MLLVQKLYKFPTEKQQNLCQKQLNTDFSIKSNIVSSDVYTCTCVAEVSALQCGPWLAYNRTTFIENHICCTGWTTR